MCVCCVNECMCLCVNECMCLLRERVCVFVRERVCGCVCLCVIHFLLNSIKNTGKFEVRADN